jgi:lysozyme
MKSSLAAISFFTLTLCLVCFFASKDLAPIVEYKSKAILVKPDIKQRWENELINQVKMFENFKSRPYRCPAGVLTVGYGHTGKFASSTLTEQAAEDLLKEELENYRAIVRRNVKVPLTEYQTCALVSFTYNCGEGNLRRLINGNSRLNSGNYKSINKLMPLYSKAKGKTLNGLIKRRMLEVSMWNGESLNDKSA